MVLGVSRRVHRHQDASRSDLDLLPVVEHVQALGRRGFETSVEGIEERAVDPRCGIDEARRVGQVASPLLVHVDGRRGEGAGDIADPARVVEVNMRHGDTGQVRRTKADLVQGGEQHRHRRLAPGLDEHRSGPLNQVAGGDPLPPAEHGVDFEDALRNGARWRHGGDGVAAGRIVHMQAGIGVAMGAPTVVVRPAHGASSPMAFSAPPRGAGSPRRGRIASPGRWSRRSTWCRPRPASRRRRGSRGPGR